MNRKVFLSIAVLMLAALACSTVSSATNRVVGSGNVVSEARSVSGFTSVELQGSGNVIVQLGATESVTVKADDNIVPLIETVVSNGRLFIKTKPFANVVTSNDVQVSVVAKSLQGVTLSGSGRMNVSGVTGPQFTVELPGSGDLTVVGSVDQVNITLPGSGTIVCDGLKAHNAIALLAGSGTMTLYADKSLDAKVLGSGTIRYEGSPAQVTKSITGSGSITP